jgi:nicotinate-nucleotide adenylyltransferase
LSESSAPLTPVGVFGGTFNPVHFGHLRSALELAERLQLAQLRLMPCAVPPHREAPACDARHRLAMLELAVAGEPVLAFDDRELRRGGTSYTIDSLIELRRELGPGGSLCLVMGCDAVRALTTWHRWDELLDWAHVAVIARPGWELPASGPVAHWLHGHRISDPAALRQRSHGGVVVAELRPLAISSTEIRALIARGSSPRFLLPDAVLEYIRVHDLYH